jgi:DNA repair protein RecO (recombination protein O)
MALKRTTGVVIKVIDHGESDKIVVLYGPHRGKLAGIAKGAKKSKKRFTNKLELFSRLDILYNDRPRGGLVQITEAELLNSYITLRENYDRYVGAALICELMNFWSKENDADEKIYDLLIWALSELNSSNSMKTILIFFQVKLYTLLGYKLHLSSCILCGDVGNSSYGFLPSRNGLICSNCRPTAMPGDMIPLSMGTIKLLQSAQELPLEKLIRLRFSVASEKEALLLFRAYGNYLLQREIIAWNFILGKLQADSFSPGR